LYHHGWLPGIGNKKPTPNAKDVLMKRIARLIFAILLLLSGATLVPAMGLPNQGFAWQLYADAYQTIQVFLPLIFK
jgi:hypothetical protein